ncbi:MAG: hypothetical protein QXT16_04470 [Candidatus Caldarchaeum sp.]
MEKIAPQIVSVLRITRHEASPEQMNALREVTRKLIGDPERGDFNINVIQFTQTLESPEHFFQVWNENGRPPVVEVVLPINMLASILEIARRQGLNIHFIRAIMNRVDLGGGEVRFEFAGYEKIVKVEVVTERLV